MTLVEYVLDFVYVWWQSDKSGLRDNRQAHSGTLTRREIVGANANLGELRRDKEKLSSPISCELRRVKGKWST